MNTLKTIVIILICVYSSVLIFVHLIQERFIFMAEKLPQDFQYDTPGQELTLTTKDEQRINALFFEGTNNIVLIYFHGNAGSLSSWQYVANDLNKLGYSVLMIDYRGYGKSTGEISEAGLYADAMAAYDYVATTYPNKAIVVYGRSIGTGVAVDLSTKVNVKGLVLEAPYTSLPNLGQQKLPLLLPKLLLRFKFDNMSKINNIKCPIVFIHGTEDEVIPFDESQKLSTAFQGLKKFYAIDGGRHNNLAEYHQYENIMRGLPELIK